MQQQRIANGVRSGQMSPSEAAKSRKHRNKISTRTSKPIARPTAESLRRRKEKYQQAAERRKQTDLQRKAQREDGAPLDEASFRNHQPRGHRMVAARFCFGDLRARAIQKFDGSSVQFQLDRRESSRSTASRLVALTIGAVMLGCASTHASDTRAGVASCFFAT